MTLTRTSQHCRRQRVLSENILIGEMTLNTKSMGTSDTPDVWTVHTKVKHCEGQSALTCT